jgi:hypothetical protein
VPEAATKTAAISPATDGASENPAVALGRRDWMLSVMQKLRELRDVPGKIPVVRGLSSTEFLREYYALGRPVILDGEMDDWPARQLWHAAYLKRKLGSTPVVFQSRRSANPEFELYKDAHRSVLSFDAYMDMIEKNPGNDAYITAYNTKENVAAYECLQEDVRPLSKFLTGKPGLMWIGPLGTFTPLHHDLTNNLLAQVVGQKRCILVPPSDSRYLYNHRHVFSAVHDIMDDERLEQFPLARNAVPYEAELEAGQVLFIPIGWWHQVTALDFSVSYTYTDFIWRNAFHEDFPSD